MDQKNNPFGSDTIETVSSAAPGSPSAPGAQQQQVHIEVEDTTPPVTYSSTVRVSGTAEEFTLEFAGPVRHTSPKQAKVKIDQRIILNPWAAKRLVMALHQAVTRYEQTYGPLEMDVRKRMVQPPPTDTPSKLS